MEMGNGSPLPGSVWGARLTPRETEACWGSAQIQSDSLMSRPISLAS